MFRVIAILLMLAVPVAAGEVTLTVSSFPPGQDLKPGVTILIQAKGVPVEQEFAWDLIPAPSPGETIELSTRDGPLMLFASTAGGPRTVFLQLAFPGLDPRLRCDFGYGGQGPSPDPDPQPDPDPSPAIGKLSVLGLYETVVGEDEDGPNPLTPQQRDIPTSRLVRDYLIDHCVTDGDGPQYRFLDEDSDLSKMSAEWQQAAEAIRVAPGFVANKPWVHIANDKGARHIGPWPKDPKAMLQLLRQFGGE